jgi:excinuclease ABC subunit A
MEHNLKNINVKIPLNILTVVTGVSGSGKSTLVNDIVYKSLKKHFEGTIDDMINCYDPRRNASMTARYISGEKEIPVPTRRRKWNNAIEFVGCMEHNLKNINVKIPLNILTVVTGVSGSGKSTLVNDIVYKSLKKHFEGTSDKVGSFGKIQGSLMAIQAVEYINQNPIERS